MAEPDAVGRFVHAVWHLDCRKERTGYAECTLLNQCWGYPITEPPEWAWERAESRAPAREWCPTLNPGLLCQLDPGFSAGVS
jgi:hypothetical protein